MGSEILYFWQETSHQKDWNKDLTKLGCRYAINVPFLSQERPIYRWTCTCTSSPDYHMGIDLCYLEKKEYRFITCSGEILIMSFSITKHLEIN